MSKFTITIEDKNGCLSVTMAGDGKPEGFAGLTAVALMRLAQDVVPKAVKRAAMNSDCKCEKCKAARAEVQTEASAPNGKPTIH
ncbi:hypothetical protein [Pseudomonas citronellolis]|uniref:hypothetical protein n=1 Tax=Pseudomonas citronellolis TaxID=53408 RepID=UPI000778D556|nr:hypothetical protein [Pseudomonas citronellolis]AMO73825.1 hypothetical protein PcP3B5_03120 [Pseudomonas citronellolis]